MRRGAGDEERGGRSGADGRRAVHLFFSSSATPRGFGRERSRSGSVSPRAGNGGRTPRDAHLGERSAASGIVDDVSDNTLDVTMALGVVLRGGRGWSCQSGIPATGSRRSLAMRKKTRARRLVQRPARPRRGVSNAREGLNRFGTRRACRAARAVPGERTCGPRGGVVRGRKPSGGPASRSRTMAMMAGNVPPGGAWLRPCAWRCSR